MEIDSADATGNPQDATPIAETSSSIPKLPTYSSYREYIDAHVSEWPEYRWLQHFLGKPGSQPSETERTVFDSVGGSLIEQGHFTSDIRGLSHILSSCSPQVCSRLIIGSYRQAWGIDRQVC